MKTTVAITILFLFCTSCFIQKGEWVDDKCRPKIPDFKLLGVPFKESDKLVFTKVYIADTQIKSAAFKFYPDGRLLYFFSNDEYDLTKKEIIGKTWDNAKFIGYWRVEDKYIEVQYFVCGNSGVYIDKHGRVEGDTIFFERDCGSGPFNREKCLDKYILSGEF